MSGAPRHRPHPPPPCPKAGSSRRSPCVDAPPNSPTQRANSCPKVANPFCRLPLPTFFHQLEAAHLGDLLRLWVRRAAQARISAQIFKGCSARAKRSTNVCALPAIAAISPRNAIPWRAPAPACAHADAVRGCQGKETSLLGARSNVSGRGCVTASALRARAGMLAGFPFSAMEHTHVNASSLFKRPSAAD